MAPSAPAAYRQGYLRIHIEAFEQGGQHFVRSPELNFVARGETGLDAMVNFVNMATVSIGVAAERGNLAALLKHSGAEVMDAPPPALQAGRAQRDLFLPIIPAANARSRPVG